MVCGQHIPLLASSSRCLAHILELRVTCYVLCVQAAGVEQQQSAVVGEATGRYRLRREALEPPRVADEHAAAPQGVLKLVPDEAHGLGQEVDRHHAQRVKLQVAQVSLHNGHPLFQL
eukprot:CAMPEP_0173179856 /NCGR_PEP_ID=MMETSP1141-20130122/6374_1 /TAXON_ID=483371 /ORGANISM="non described non described, Strain CCMP2298" /LENGTH=116 /DNA_ID=CAMNT_0014102605 /DNA_START=347 /DNA_END=697 /DNA_ORIENTATION=-